MKKLLSVLLVAAVLMSGLSLAAFAQQENPFVLQDPYLIEYSVGERGLNFSSPNTIQQVERAFAGLDPTPLAQDGAVEQDARYLKIWQENFPKQFIFQDDRLMTAAKSYQTPQALLDLEETLQAQMEALDPYGCFTWAENYASLCLLDNSSRYAALVGETENKILLLERLQSLQPQKIIGSQKETLGKQRTGAAELRVNVTDADSLMENVTYSYQLYEKGVSVTRYTDTGAGLSLYFACDPDAVGSLASQMQKLYSASQTKSATWLAILNLDRVEQFTVTRKSDTAASALTGWNRAALVDLLRTLPVEGAEEINRLWTKPDVEYQIRFTNGLTYRVQLQGNALRIWASDMPQVLSFTVPQEKADELLKETANRIGYERDGVEKPNVYTG